jgi:S-layer protein
LKYKKLEILSLGSISNISAYACATDSQWQVLKAGYVRGQVSTGDGAWSPQNFGWFYYDLDEGLRTESLFIDVEDRRAEEGHIIYRSDVFLSEFEYMRKSGELRAEANDSKSS